MKEPIPVKLIETQYDRLKDSPLPVQNVVTGTWREIAARWIFDQGTSTILLCAILGSIIWYTPNFLEHLQSGYNKNMADFEKTLNIILASHDRDREAFEKALSNNPQFRKTVVRNDQ